MCSGRECGHVQGGSHGASAADDGPFCFELSAVAVERCEASEGGGLASVDVAEFGEFGDECDGGNQANPGDAVADVGFSLPVVVRFDEGQDLLFEGFDLLVEHVDDLLQAALDGLGMGRCLAVLLGGAEIDELSASGDELVEFGLFFVDFCERPRLDVLSESRDDGGVDAVGFGQDSEGLGEVSHLPRIDDGDEVSGADEFGHEESFVSPGGFDDDEAGSGLG